MADFCRERCIWRKQQLENETDPEADPQNVCIQSRKAHLTESLNASQGERLYTGDTCVQTKSQVNLPSGLRPLQPVIVVIYCLAFH